MAWLQGARDAKIQGLVSKAFRMLVMLSRFHRPGCWVFSCQQPHARANPLFPGVLSFAVLRLTKFLPTIFQPRFLCPALVDIGEDIWTDRAPDVIALHVMMFMQ